MTVAARDAAVVHPATIDRSAAPTQVMHVITSLDVGGAETMLARLVAGDRAGSVSHVVVSLKPDGARRPSLEADGIPSVTSRWRAALALCYDFVDEAAAILRRGPVAEALRRDGAFTPEVTLKTMSSSLARRYRKHRRRTLWRSLRNATFPGP